MLTNLPPIVQVAGIHDRAEAEMLISAGIRWLGFPLCLAVHPQDLSVSDATAVIAAIGASARCVLITYLDTATEVLALADTLGVNAVQLHGPVPLMEVRRLKHQRPDLFIIKSLVVREDNTAALQRSVTEFSAVVSAFITDTHDPASGADGATGKTHDWQVSRELVARSPRPVILAGGLTADNVAEAIRTVRPAGVDVHTGVEGLDGRKSLQKTTRFVEAAQAAFGEIAESERG